MRVPRYERRDQKVGAAAYSSPRDQEVGEHLMADIFISYAKSDRAKAQTLANAFEREGWSVWWDPKIPPGQTFDEGYRSSACRIETCHRSVVGPISQFEMGQDGSIGGKPQGCPGAGSD